MLTSTLATIATLTLAASPRAASSRRDVARDSAPERPGAAAVAEGRRALAEYQLELERILAEEDRASRARQAGRPSDGLRGDGPSRCRLMQPGADAATTRDCVRCHAATGRDDHPVDVDYEGARRARRSGSTLRPLAEVVRRGVLVPDGEVRCVTCHDGRSPWKHRIALPPGAPARPAVNPRDPTTYDDRRAPEAQLQPGSEVTARPLCLACHSLE